MWNDKKQTLTLMARQGEYEPDNDMRIRVSLPDGRKTDVVYNGKKKTVKF
jgi:hypothetical protein